MNHFQPLNSDSATPRQWKFCFGGPGSKYTCITARAGFLSSPICPSVTSRANPATRSPGRANRSNAALAVLGKIKNNPPASNSTPAVSNPVSHANRHGNRVAPPGATRLPVADDRISPDVIVATADTKNTTRKKKKLRLSENIAADRISRNAMMPRNRWSRDVAAVRIFTTARNRTKCTVACNRSRDR